ncbi:MAG: hypothetical protein AAFW97_03565 [Pseudomonadota bacterium]
MNTEQNFQSRFFAAVAAAAVSAMCILGTVGPVQAGELFSPTQVTHADTQLVAA